MNLELSPEAEEFGRAARKAFEAAGGDELARGTGTGTDAAVVEVLGGLGAWELDARGSADEAEAAAALCRSAGWWGVRHPVAERLARPRGGDVDALAVVAAPPDRSDLRWAVADLDDPGAALGLVLPCWTLLGMLDRAMAATTDHVTARHQFGQPLSSFQGVQFQLTDAEVERVGVEELAKHALWSGATVDALGLRLAAIEAAEVVFRITHQLHGAIGFCDETMLSWLSRASQPLRRQPLGPSATRAVLTERISAHGFAGLFA